MMFARAALGLMAEGVVTKGLMHDAVIMLTIRGFFAAVSLGMLDWQESQD